MYNITLDQLDKIVDKVFTEKSKRREFKIHTGCKTYRYSNLEIGNICSDPNCYSCSSFRELLLEEINKMK